MREMAAGLEARVELTTFLRGKGDKEELTIKATAYPFLTTKADQRHSVCLSATIPASSASMGTAVIFRLLLALDYEVSKAWATRNAT